MGFLAVSTGASGFAIGLPLRTHMNWLATSVLLLHLLAGTVLAILGLRIIRSIWSAGDRGHRIRIVVLAIAIATGGIEAFSAIRGNAVPETSFLWKSHFASGFGACIVGLAGAGYSWSKRRKLLGTARSASAVAALATILPIGGCVATTLTAYLPEHHESNLTATTAEQADNPLFPAQLRDQNGNAASLWRLQESDRCGQGGCHEHVHSDWNLSPHRFAGEDPIYLKALTEFRAERGPKAGLWCASCHDPQRAVRSDLSISGRSNGVDCLSCHSMVRGEQYGNGAYELSVQQPYPFADASSGWRKSLHQFLVRSRPAPHRIALRKPVLSTAESCIPCHQQSYEAAQNGYRHIPTMTTGVRWREGAASGSTVVTAFPEVDRKLQRSECQSCHFKQDRSEHSNHSSENVFAANRSLTSIGGSIDVRLDLFALRVRERPGREGERWLAPLEEARLESGVGGKEATLDLMIVNRSGAHSFPGGYDDLREAWIELDATADGVSFYSSGKRAYAEAPLPTATVRFGAAPLDRNGSRIFNRALQRQVSELPSTSIKPGASALRRYSFKIPTSARHLTISARLLYRPLTFEAAHWASGVTAKIAVAKTIAQASAGLTFDKQEPAAKFPIPEWERWTRYGLAALDMQTPEPDRALRALQRAQSIAPMQPEVALAMGRCYLREPALLAARSQFERARQLAPHSDEAVFGLGSVLRQQGQYDAALALLVPLCERAEYKEDANLLRETAKAYYYSGRYSEAATRLEQALAADPNDERAHFELQQCYRRLQRIPEARREETILRYLSTTPWSQAIQRKAMRSNRP